MPPSPHSRSLSLTAFYWLFLPALPCQASCQACPIPSSLATLGFLHIFLTGDPASSHSVSQPLSDLEVAKLIFNSRSDVSPPESSLDSRLPIELSTGPSLGLKKPQECPPNLPSFLAEPGYTLCAIAQCAKLSHLCDQSCGLHPAPLSAFIIALFLQALLNCFLLFRCYFQLNMCFSSKMYSVLCLFVIYGVSFIRLDQMKLPTFH